MCCLSRSMVYNFDIFALFKEVPWLRIRVSGGSTCASVSSGMLSPRTHKGASGLGGPLMILTPRGQRQGDRLRGQRQGDNSSDPWALGCWREFLSNKVEHNWGRCSVSIFDFYVYAHICTYMDNTHLSYKHSTSSSCRWVLVLPHCGHKLFDMIMIKIFVVL